MFDAEQKIKREYQAQDHQLGDGMYWSCMSHGQGASSSKFRLLFRDDSPSVQKFTNLANWFSSAITGHNPRGASLMS